MGSNRLQDELRRMAAMFAAAANLADENDYLRARLAETERRENEWMRLALDGNATLERHTLAFGLALAGQKDAALAMLPPETPNDR